MLRSTHDLENVAISASDGRIGHVSDFYFDDDTWTIRYVVVETGSWLSTRKVLISPIALKEVDWLQRSLSVAMTKAQVRDSPDIDTDQPVSRQNEEDMLGYWGQAAYWGGAGLWGEGLYPYTLAPGFSGYGVERVERERELEAYLAAERARHRNDDPHLRSCDAVAGYHIQASDGMLGQVASYLIDDETWAIRYLVIDTSSWWIGHKVLIAPSWISGVHWATHTVSVDLTREKIRSAPSYDPHLDWSQEKDLSQYSHYGRTGYWRGSTVLEREI